MDELTSTSNTTTIEIRPRKNWRIVFNVISALVWGCLSFASLVGFSNRFETGRSTLLSLAIVLFFLAGFVRALYVFAKVLFYKELVAVDPIHLSIQGQLLIFSFREGQYDNASVSNLRYEEWSNGETRENGIRFEWCAQTITFAHQADSTASWDLIDRLTTIYPFSTPDPTPSPAVTRW